jgi:hypothetical protein
MLEYVATSRYELPESEIEQPLKLAWPETTDALCPPVHDNVAPEAPLPGSMLRIMVPLAVVTISPPASLTVTTMGLG